MKDKFYKWDKFIGSYDKMPNTVDAVADYKAKRKAESKKKKVIVLPKPSSYFQYVTKSDETLVFKEKKKGKRKLTDQDVIFARENIKDYTYQGLADILNVSKRTLENAVKGITFGHLNPIFRPRR
jgi:hypothetical protein